MVCLSPRCQIGVVDTKWALGSLDSLKKVFEYQFCVRTCDSQIVWHLKVTSSPSGGLNDKKSHLFGILLYSPPHPTHTKFTVVCSLVKLVPDEARSWLFLCPRPWTSLWCFVEKMVRSFLPSCAGLCVCACVYGWLCVWACMHRWLCLCVGERQNSLRFWVLTLCASCGGS